MILPDSEIRELAKRGMIYPFYEGNNAVGRLSNGLSSYGYDITLGTEFKLFRHDAVGTVIDPKRFEPMHLQSIEGQECIIPAHSFVLAYSMEYFKIPRDIICIVLGKSTYARCGLIVNITALEPAWEGQVTIEISNTTPAPVKIYSGEGIAQVLFFRAALECEKSYEEKKGKYQRQTGITYAR